MKIAIGSDHAGFELKESLKRFLSGKGYQIVDVGPPSAERSDYPDFASKVAQAVSQKETERGVLVCGSGIGMCIAANRYKGVRAAVLRIEEDARLSREHNDSNIACLGGRLTDSKKAESLLDIFLNTSFEGGRHIGRIQKIDI